MHMIQTLARKLRSNPTDAEIRMWRLLHPFRTGGYHFRKQVQLGPYVADFACHRVRLIIEVDGGQHYTNAGKMEDARRDGYLNTRGYTVLRFSNIDLLNNPEAVFGEIGKHLMAFTPRVRKGTD